MDLASLAGKPTSRDLPRQSLLAVRKHMLFVIGLLLISSVGFLIGVTRATVRRGKGALEVENRFLDLGRVASQERFSCTLPIRNTSRRVVMIEDIRGSCTCISVEPTSMVLGPGEIGSTTLTIDLTSPEERDADLHLRPFAARVIPVAKGGLMDHPGWELRAEVWSPLLFSPRALEFPVGSLICGTTFQPRFVEITAGAPLARLTADCDRKVASAVVAPYESDVARFRLGVAMSEGLAAGAYRFPVTVQGITRDGVRLPRMSISVTADVVEDVQIVPGEIRFHAAHLGETLEETVLLSSRTGSGFRIVKVTAETVGLTAQIIGDRQVRIRQEAFAAGSHTGVIRITVDQNMNRSYDLLCTLRFDVIGKCAKPT